MARANRSSELPALVSAAVSFLKRCAIGVGGAVPPVVVLLLQADGGSNADHWDAVAFVC